MAPTLTQHFFLLLPTCTELCLNLALLRLMTMMPQEPDGEEQRAWAEKGIFKLAFKMLKSKRKA